MFPFTRSRIALLPLTTEPEKSRQHLHFSKQHIRLLLVAVATFIICFSCLSSQFGQDLLDQAIYQDDPKDLPPMFERFHEWERNLPQHNESLPAPEGKDARFLWIANHVYGVGWGNAMQEMLFNAHLAYTSNRVYVFDNYTWARGARDYARYNGKKIPSRIPVSTMLSGPIIGDPFGPGIDRPRAVSREYFKKVCPNPTYVPVKEFSKSLSHLSGPEYFASWTKKLLELPDRCVEIQDGDDEIFNVWMFGQHRVTQLFPELKKSPILQQLGWSSLIRGAYLTNQALFETPSTPNSLQSLPSHRPSIPGLLAVHVRRGDFEAHCRYLTKMRSRFHSFNLLEGIPDGFEAPPAAGYQITPENKESYRKRCYPTMDEFVEKIMAVRAGSATRDKNSTDSGDGERVEGNGTEIRKIHLMTNAKKEWIDELKAKLMEKAEWDAIVSSRDLQLTREQKYVAQAVDMYIAERAQEFIGNGFSSLTGNVVLLRMAHDYAPDTVHLW